MNTLRLLLSAALLLGSAPVHAALPSFRGRLMRGTSSAAMRTVVPGAIRLVRPPAGGSSLVVPRAFVQETPGAAPAARAERAEAGVEAAAKPVETDRAEGSGAPGARESAAQAAVSPKAFDGSAAAEEAELTVFVFLNGHNNLDRFGLMNILDMEKIGSVAGKMNVVVQWASLGKPTKRFLVQKGRAKAGGIASPIIQELAPVDMGDWKQLVDFVAWGKGLFPAKRYVVDIWNHGAGWRTSTDSVPPSSSMPGSVVPEDVSYDDLTHNKITTEQLAPAMTEIKKVLGQPVDILAFDACLMAMSEVAAEVVDSVRYVSASQEVEPGSGWPYDKVLGRWAQLAGDEGRELARALAQEYVKAYGPGGQFGGQGASVTYSALDVAKMPALAKASAELAKFLMDGGVELLDLAKDAAARAQRYSFTDYHDLAHFVRNLAADPKGRVPKALTDAVLAAVKEFAYVSVNSPAYAESTGVSVWLPNQWEARPHLRRYLGLAWHGMTGWGTLVAKILRLDKK